MCRRIYISFFLSIGFWAFNLGAQDVLFQLGGDRPESWDAVSCSENNNCFFALGFQQHTEVNGKTYSALDRDVLIGRIENERPFILGHLASSANTQVHFIQTDDSGIYLGGNAFSYLIYRGDTLFSDEGINKAFVLKLNHEGEYMFHSTLDASASAICLDGWAGGDGIIGLFEINDTVNIPGSQFIPNAGSAGLVALWGDQLELDTAFVLDGEGSIKPVAIAGDKDALYIAGNFRGSIQFGNDSIFTRTADDDGFLAKWDRSTRQAQFTNHLSGVYQDNVKSLAVINDQIIVGGQFIGAISFEELQIITGLSVAGFIGAFHTNGEAIWLKGLFGNSDLLSVEHIAGTGSEILFSVLTGEELFFSNDTLRLPWTLGEIHSVIGRLDQNGNLQEWNILEGDPIALVSTLASGQDALKIAMAFTGRYNGYSSSGGYDVLWLQEELSILPSVIIEPLLTYPNPATGYIHFEKQFSATPYILIDQQGHIVQSGELSGSRLNIGGLQRGAYILWVQGKVRYVAKFIKLQ